KSPKTPVLPGRRVLPLALLSLVVVGVRVDLACAGGVFVRGGSLASSTLGVLLGSELGLLGAAGARLRFLPQAGCLLAALLELAAAAEHAERDRQQHDDCDDDDDDPECAHGGLACPPPRERKPFR